MTSSFNPSTLDRIKYEQGMRYDTELAKAFGVTSKTISAWRAGETLPSFGAVSRMVMTYGIPYAELAKASSPEPASKAA